jgi:hypothetical protein
VSCASPGILVQTGNEMVTGNAHLGPRTTVRQSAQPGQLPARAQIAIFPEEGNPEVVFRKTNSSRPGRTLNHVE